MGTDLLRVAKRHSQQLRRQAPVTYWSLLSQLYHAHKSTVDLTGLREVIRWRDFNGLLDLADSWSTQKYSTAYEHFVRNQFAYLAKKYVLPSKYDPEGNAMRKFLSSERSCEITNRRFKAWDIYASSSSETRNRYSKQLRRMKNFIAYVLGDDDSSFPLDEILDGVGFGPGASIGVSGNATNAFRKLVRARERVSVTPSALTYFAAAVHRNLWLRRIYSSDPDGHGNGQLSWLHAVKENAEFVRYNKLAFVPKTAKIHRIIAVEPLGNSILQKGCDLAMRRRLLRIGIDLSDQRKNQSFAKTGSVTGDIATIDLSAASDSVAYEVVAKLFPPMWVAFLKAIRSTEYLYGGSKIPYHKFSSMGNGTTFPIETLIFVAACHACGCGNPGRDFTVYGDDIAIPADKAKDVIKLLRILGFRTNNDKTFVTGPFRESCGEDWFGGVSVRPFVLDYALDSVQNVFKFLNQMNEKPLWSSFFQPVRSFILRLLPARLQLYRPFPGEVSSAIDARSGEHLTCPTCHYEGNGVWSWTEMSSTPVKDDDYLLSKCASFAEEPPDFVRWYGVHTLTSGINAIDDHFWKKLCREAENRGTKYRYSRVIPWFSLRNVVRTDMTRESHAGASSNWLPGEVL